MSHIHGGMGQEWFSSYPIAGPLVSVNMLSISHSSLLVSVLVSFLVSVCLRMMWVRYVMVVCEDVSISFQILKVGILDLPNV